MFLNILKRTDKVKREKWKVKREKCVDVLMKDEL